MTLEEFSLIAPSTAEIRFYVDEDRVVKGITISTTACTGLNTYEFLLLIESITVNIGGVDYTFDVINRELKSGYFFLTTANTFISTLSTPVENSDSGDCNLTSFIPSVYDPTFENSDYNALFANATDIRLNTFAYDVDRVKNQAIPTNLANILADNAINAPVPDSNYSSIGMLRSRYEGSETSVLDYGIDSIIGPTPFECSVYSTDIETDFICSQSYSDRSITSLSFVKSLSLPSDIDAYPDFGYRSNVFSEDGQIVSSNPGTIYARLDADTTVKTIRFRPSRDLQPGDVLAISNSSSSNSGLAYTAYEYVQVLSVDSVVPYNSTYSEYTITMQRGLNNISNTVLSYDASTPLYIFKIKADAIYTTENNKPIKVTNKLVYLPNTKQILYIGTTGKAIYIRETCTI